MAEKIWFERFDCVGIFVIVPMAGCRFRLQSSNLLLETLNEELDGVLTLRLVVPEEGFRNTVLCPFDHCWLSQLALNADKPIRGLEVERTIRYYRGRYKPYVAFELS